MRIFSPTSENHDNHSSRPVLSDRILNRNQIDLIQDALRTLGDYGELHLIVKSGNLRFLVIQKSIDVRQALLGSLGEEGN